LLKKKQKLSLIKNFSKTLQALIIVKQEGKKNTICALDEQTT
jgi:hypothetical protein